VAERLCLDVLELAPDRPIALRVLYEIRKTEGNQRAAEMLIRRDVRPDPNNFGATNELALILLANHDVAQANESGLHVDVRSRCAAQTLPAMTAC
jgi:hypothetical protein